MSRTDSRAKARTEARRKVVRVSLVAMAIVVALGVIGFLVVSVLPDKPHFRAVPGPGAYQGLGTWIDIFETDVWADPEGTVAALDARGVHTIYLQSSNYTRPTAILYPDATARFLDAAHERQIHVVAWYLPGLDDIERDLDRSLAAIRFESDNGEGFDSFGMDIESVEVKDPAERTAALLRLSRQLRAEVGADYPLGAITPNPVRVATDTPYWPEFPYPELARIYDVMVPMIYFGAVAEGKQGAFEYTREGIRLVREGSKPTGVAVHAIGGLGEALTAAEVRGFVKAGLRGRVNGVSIYNYSTTSDTDWEELQVWPEPGPSDTRTSVGMPVPSPSSG